MIIKTSTGFEQEIEDDFNDDIEFLEILMKVQEDKKTEAIYFPKLLEIILGKEGKARLYDHCRNEKGKVAITAISPEFEEIFEQITDGKKK